MKTVFTNTKHTPGPWRVKKSTRFNEHGIQEYAWVGFGRIGDESTILSVNLPSEENEANARLIAAAPELLQAIKEIKETITYGLLINTLENKACTELLIDDLNKLIEKAEGKL
jgi:hypothetical protein